MGFWKNFIPWLWYIFQCKIVHEKDHTLWIFINCTTEYVQGISSSSCVSKEETCAYLFIKSGWVNSMHLINHAYIKASLHQVIMGSGDDLTHFVSQAISDKLLAYCLLTHGGHFYLSLHVLTNCVFYSVLLTKLLCFIVYQQSSNSSHHKNDIWK